MSYIRSGWSYMYVDGYSDDYVFGTDDGIVDYGGISNNTMVEFIAEILHDRNYRKDDVVYRDYLLKQLASILSVKLREKPLTYDEIKMDPEIENRQEIKDIIEMLSTKDNV